MTYQNINTKEVVNYFKLKEIYPNVTLALDGTSEILDYHVVEDTEKPTYDLATQKLIELSPINYKQVWEVVDLVDEEIEANFKASVPSKVTMRQARLALIEVDLLSTINAAIANGSDEVMKVEWEYSDEVRRDWDSLIAMATQLGMTENDIDNLFILASSK